MIRTQPTPAVGPPRPDAVRILKPLLAIVAILALPWALMAAYMSLSGIVVPGRVLDKQESIAMPGGELWQHRFEVTYQFQPRDSVYPETAVQRLDAARFRALHVGSEVQVCYSPSRLLRHIKGAGMFLVDSPISTRLSYAAPNPMELARVAGLALALLLGFLAYRKRSRVLGGAAVFAASACFPEALLITFGILAFPVLFWAWRGNGSKGYGGLLLAAIGLTAVILYLRIPWPATAPQGPLVESTATVRRLRVVDQLWTHDAGRGNSRFSGLTIRQPFLMLDLAYAPRGASEPIHVLDRVDLNSVRDLREGSRVAIEYSATDPDFARVTGATRDYAREAFIYLFGESIALGVLVAFVAMPARRFIEKWARVTLGRMMSRSEAAGRLGRRAEDDPSKKSRK